MNIGRRCTLGCETWPDALLFRKCYVCGEDTRRVRGETVEPLSDEEAMKIVLYHEFEKFYERRCRRLGVPVEGPLEDPQAAPGQSILAGL